MKFHRRRFTVIAPLVGLVMLTICAAGTAAVSRDVTSKQRAAYERAYHQVANKFSARTPGRDIVKWGYGASGKRATRKQVATSLSVLKRMLAPPPAPVVSYVPASAPTATTTTTTTTTAAVVAAAPVVSGDYSSVPGVPASFAACVAMRESTDGAGSSNIYGIIPASGVDVSGDSVAQQKEAFAQMYAAQGSAPWSPYDGC